MEVNKTNFITVITQKLILFFLNSGLHICLILRYETTWLTEIIDTLLLRCDTSVAVCETVE